MTDFQSLANPGIQNLKPYTPGKPLFELERELGITDSIKLASNENPLGPSPEALAAIEASGENLALYPDAMGYRLRHALVQRIEADGVPIRPDQITLGNGSNDVLVLAAQVFLNAGLNAVFSQYAFAVYPIAVQASGAEARMVPALPDDDSMPLGHDLQAMLSAVDENTRMVFIANPNNPTGTWLEQDALEAFLQQLPQQVIAVVDEAYFEYGEAWSAMDWLQNFPNLIVTRTFSKAYGLAALRVGYSVSSSEIADLLNRLRQPFNVNSLALIAAEAALADRGFIERSVEMNAAGLQQLRQGLQDQGYSVIPSRGNFVLVDLDRDAGPVYEALLAEGVITRPVGNYGLPRHLRITVGTPEQNQRLLDSLARVA